MISPYCSFLNSVGFSIFKDQHGLELVYGWKKLSTWRNVPWLYWFLCYASRNQVGLLKSILISAVTFLSDLYSCADAVHSERRSIHCRSIYSRSSDWHGAALACPMHLCSLHPHQVWCRRQSLNRSRHCCTGLFLWRCKTLHLSLLSFTRFLAALPSSTSSHPPSLVSSVNVMGVCLIASSIQWWRRWRGQVPGQPPVVVPLLPGRAWPVNHYLQSLIAQNQ